jgi:acyl carrier protein
VTHGTIPKTSSGKVQRHACRVAYQRGQLAAVARSGGDPPAEVGVESVEPGSADLARFLTDQVAHLAGSATHRIELDLPPASLGLDSLGMVELRNAIESCLGVSLPLQTVAESPSLATLCGEIRERLRGPARRIPAAPEAWAGGALPLSAGQKALWVAERLAPESGVYNIAVAARAGPGLDVRRLQGALWALAVRHPALRTRFGFAAGQPFQQVEPAPSGLDFVVVDASAWSEAELREHLGREAFCPLDLASGVTLRVRIYERPRQERTLLFVIHHLVADFWSLAVLFRELERLYAGGELDAVPALRFVDWLHWHAAGLATEEGGRAAEYWRRQLAGNLTPLELPTDRRRPLVQSFHAKARPFHLTVGLAGRLRELVRAHGVTLYVGLLSAFQALLARYTGMDDLLVGSPAAGRLSSQLSGIVGYFVNPVALRARFDDDPAFERHLARTRQSVIGALEHQEYPFALLAEELERVRDPGRSPLIQAMLVFQQSNLPEQRELAAFSVGAEGARLQMAGLALESLALPERRISWRRPGGGSRGRSPMPRTCSTARRWTACCPISSGCWRGLWSLRRAVSRLCLCCRWGSVSRHWWSGTIPDTRTARVSICTGCSRRRWSARRRLWRWSSERSL